MSSYIKNHLSQLSQYFLYSSILFMKKKIEVWFRTYQSDFQHIKISVKYGTWRSQIKLRQHLLVFQLQYIIDHPRNKM